MRPLPLAALGLLALSHGAIARAAEAKEDAPGDRYEFTAYGETYVEVFRRALLPGAAGSIVETDTALPIHQYLQLRVRDLDTGWQKDAIDVELSAFGRVWPTDVDLERRLDGDVQTANVGYRQGGFQLRLGRQVRAGGAARYVRFDGLSLGLRLAAGLEIEGYGGLTALPRFDGRPGYHHLGAAQDSLLRDPNVLPEPNRTGYRLAGARIGYRSSKAGIGVSFHEQHEADELAHRNLGADGRLDAIKDLSLVGAAVFDLDATDVADARLWADFAATHNVDFAAEYLHAVPSLYLSRQSVLSVFSTDAYDEVGGRLTVRPMRGLSLDGGSWVNFYDASERGARGQVGARLIPDAAKTTVIGIGYTRLVAARNGYHAMRATLSQQLVRALRGTLEAHAFFYDEEIQSRQTSTVYAGSLGYDVSRSLNLLWGASVAQSPYAALDAQTLVRASYVFDASSNGGAP